MLGDISKICRYFTKPCIIRKTIGYTELLRHRNSTEYYRKKTIHIGSERPTFYVVVVVVVVVVCDQFQSGLYVLITLTCVICSNSEICITYYQRFSLLFFLLSSSYIELVHKILFTANLYSF